MAGRRLQPFPCIFGSCLSCWSGLISFFLVLQIAEETAGSWGLIKQCLRDLRVTSLPSHARGLFSLTCYDPGELLTASESQSHCTSFWVAVMLNTSLLQFLVLFPLLRNVQVVLLGTNSFPIMMIFLVCVCARASIFRNREHIIIYNISCFVCQ